MVAQDYCEGVLKKLILFSIRIYQKTLSFDHGIVSYITPVRFCRFHPTCSQYAYEAIDRFGILQGGRMGLKRILRCHPWNPGGYEPVEPESKDPPQAGV